MTTKSRSSVSVQQQEPQTKKRLLLGVIVILSMLLVAFNSIKASKPMEQPFNANYEKIYSSKSAVYIDQNITESQLQTFYSFALEEYGNANFGSAKGLLEGITQKTDKIPMSWYYLSQIYKDVYPYSLQTDKLKIALLNITKSNLGSGMKQSAYDELAKIEKNHELAIAYGKKAVAIEDNMFSRYILLTAYYNAYQKTHKQIYKTELAKAWNGRMRNLFVDSKAVPWVEEVLAQK